MTDQSHIVRPIPRRTFELTPISTESSVTPSPSPENTNADLVEAKVNGVSAPSKTRSILNLTSSTLLGIYSPTSYETSREESSSPWGTEAKTPSQRCSVDERKPSQPSVGWSATTVRVRASHRKAGLSYYLSLLLKSILLFAFGMAYGTIVTHLHDSQSFTPVGAEAINGTFWPYLIFWGFSGVALGNLLPWVDILWDDTISTHGPGLEESRRPRSSSFSSGTNGCGVDDSPGSRWNSESSADWSRAVRSIGAFVGIAFAIRKLPWQSTLQVSLTLALANPVLWYLIDRSKPGFILSAVVGVTGTFALLRINPDIVPSPATSLPPAATGNASTYGVRSILLVSSESIGVSTWIASVLFCSCVCFGNIGRRLALS